SPPYPPHPPFPTRRSSDLAYGLSGDQTTHSTIQAFLNDSHRKFDVVLCLSILHHFVMNPRTCRAEDLLRRVDAITGSVLFIDIRSEEHTSELQSPDHLVCR